jgi:hypothetical protein
MINNLIIKLLVINMINNFNVFKYDWFKLRVT